MVILITMLDQQKSLPLLNNVIHMKVCIVHIKDNLINDDFDYLVIMSRNNNYQEPLVYLT